MKFLKTFFLSIFSLILVFIVFDWILIVKEQYRAYPVDLWFHSLKRGSIDDPLAKIDTNIYPVTINEKEKTVTVSGFPFRYMNLINPTNLSYKIIKSPFAFDKNKKPIILMGCSFAYGTPLFENETLAYKLQDYSHRKVINLAYPTEGIQHVLYKIQHDEEFDKNINDAKYVVYIFMTDHLRRMYSDYFSIFEKNKSLKYKKTKNGLELVDPDIVTAADWIKTTYTGRKFNDFLYTLKSNNEKFDLLKLYLEECKKSIESKNPNCKMVVVVYNSSKSYIKNISSFRTERWKELEDEGFKVINLDKNEYNYLAEREYVANDELHPSEKAWEKISHILINELNL